MSTSMADHPPLDFEHARFDSVHLEANRFNTGPKAGKTMPSAARDVLEPLPPSGVVQGVQQQQLLETDGDNNELNNAFLPPQQVNECSNLSSAGSISDRELDATPEKVGGPSAAGGRSASRPGTASASEQKRAVRKRRRGDETPKADRKITEYIRVQSSPKRFTGRDAAAAASALNGGGDSLSCDNVQMGNTEMQVQYGAVSPGPGTFNSRYTPTQQLGSGTSGGSTDSSNQSPPGGNPRRFDQETQTDALRLAEAAGSDEVAKRDRTIEELRRQLSDSQQQQLLFRSRLDACKETIKRLLIAQNDMERKALRDKTTADNPRIGHYKLQRQGETFRDVWIDGYAFEELNARQQQIVNERNDIIKATLELKKRKPTSKEPKRSLAQQMAAVANSPAGIGLSGGPNDMLPSTSNSSSSNFTDDGFARPDNPRETMSMQEYLEQEEIYRLRKDHLKKEEADLQVERERLERERQLHARELKRASNERDSRYKDHELLSNRYLLLSLLGKGGFSEVWRAFDLDENRYVACKIHHVNREWKEDKKANYVKHAMREKDIHRSLSHPRIVEQYNLFTIDNHSFCTVLEYCEGHDLDFYLKQNKQIPEKEARSIIMQVVSALKYLAERKPPIIHYDLKPANILLMSGTTCGAIKITDFGLSKIMEGSDDPDSIELTSQFAGTYWYLPPETFVVGHAPPKISSKVDVWSVGVIFYQCIYGKRPFGHEQTQQKILEENTIIKATEVHFPSKPPVSSVAQDFIRRCLQYRKEERADVHELARHELFRPRGQKSNPPSSPQSTRTTRVESLDEM